MKKVLLAALVLLFVLVGVCFANNDLVKIQTDTGLDYFLKKSSVKVYQQGVTAMVVCTDKRLFKKIEQILPIKNTHYTEALYLFSVDPDDRYQVLSTKYFDKRGNILYTEIDREFSENNWSMIMPLSVAQQFQMQVGLYLQSGHVVEGETRPNSVVPGAGGNAADENDGYITGSERPDSFHFEAAYDMFANAIDQYTVDAIRGKKATFEEVAIVENDMDGDETVYIRAWKGKDFYIIRGYEDDTWQNDTSYLIRFWTKDSAVQFGNGMDADIKVGMKLSELSSYFGDMLQQEGKDQYSVLGDGTALGFMVRNGAVEAITYMLGMPYPEKLSKYLGLE